MLADSWIVASMVRDRIVRGAVHPVLAWAGTAVIAEQALETLLFDSPAWRAAAAPVHAALHALAP